MSISLWQFNSNEVDAHAELTMNTAPERTNSNLEEWPFGFLGPTRHLDDRFDSGFLYPATCIPMAAHAQLQAIACSSDGALVKILFLRTPPPFDPATT